MATLAHRSPSPRYFQVTTHLASTSQTPSSPPTAFTSRIARVGAAVGSSVTSKTSIVVGAGVAQSASQTMEHADAAGSVPDFLHRLDFLATQSQPFLALLKNQSSESPAAPKSQVSTHANLALCSPAAAHRAAGSSATCDVRKTSRARRF